LREGPGKALDLIYANSEFVSNEIDDRGLQRENTLNKEFGNEEEL
jgi:hypothetical protein